MGACWIAVWTALAGVAQAGTIRQRYVTTWDVAPIARIRYDRPLEVNAVRCRVRRGRDWSDWWAGRVIELGEKCPVFHLPLERLEPGTYQAQFDLRTPLGAEYVKAALRVPIIARFAGKPIVADNDLSDWPHRRFEPGLQDGASVLFAWDQHRFYVAGTRPFETELPIRIDLVPNSPSSKRYELRLAANRQVQERIIPWAELAPAGPHIGQVLRVRLGPPAAGRDAASYDLLFVGSGLKMYFGATIVSGGPGHDDQGPPPELLRGIYDRVGFDLRQAGVSWGRIEPADPGDGPSRYDWSALRGELDLYYPGLVYVSVNLHNPWAEPFMGTERYARLATRFVEAYARQCRNLGIRHFSCGFNEPGLKHVTDREHFFVENLNLVVRAIRRVVPDAVIIAGKFSGGDPEMIRSFYRAGFRDNFDVLDIHPYSNDPRTGCDMGQIVASHEALQELGMGHKRIYLGEGWGPTRNLPQVRRDRHDMPVSPAEAEVHRQYFWNGYRCLITPRADYNPEWVLGAKYFTFNDNVGGTYWRVSAKPHYNALGQIDYYTLAHIRFDNLEKMRAFFCNGGLVDFQGRPKGGWLFDFPPSLPDVRVQARAEFAYMLPGREYPVTVQVVNAEAEPITNLSIGLRDRTLPSKPRVRLTGRAAGPLERTELACGQVWQTRILARAEAERARPLRMAFEVDFTFRGLRYTADAVVRTEVRQPLHVWFDPPQVFLDEHGAGGTIACLHNNRSMPVVSEASRLELPAGLSGRSEPGRVRIEPAATARVRLSFRADEVLPAGIYDVGADWGGAAVSVFKTLECPAMSRPIRIDGDLADWPKLGKRGQIVFGPDVGLHEDAPPNPFPVPEPKGESVLRPDATSRQGTTNRPTHPVSRAEAFAAQAACAWDERYFYLAAIIQDKVHFQDRQGLDVWRGDSIQIAIDPLCDGAGSRTANVLDFRAHRRQEGYGQDDYELGIALTPVGPQVCRIWAPYRVPRGLIEQAKVQIRHADGYTTYEVAIPWAALEPLKPAVGARFRLDVLVNNSDGRKRLTLGWADAIAAGKYPSRFVPVVLRP